jgi:uncharacterized protein YbbK (DUF523 family)
MSEILMGVSACLLGEQVCYDGGHTRNAFLLEELASHVAFVPVCPEVGSGLGVPREAIRLVRRGDRVCLLGSAGVDHTAAMRRRAAKVIGVLRERDLSAFVLKRGSPSCGLERVCVWDEGAQRPSRPGRGVFAQALVDAMPASCTAPTEVFDAPTVTSIASPPAASYVRPTANYQRRHPKTSFPHQTGDLVSISRSRSAISRAFFASAS